MNKIIKSSEQITSAGSRYTSDELWHFVGHKSPEDHELNYGILRTILDTGWVTHPPHKKEIKFSFKIDITKNLADEELIVPSITCYCDIPHECLEVHMSKYGQFGVSFHRQILVGMGARPVMYIPFFAGDMFSIHGRGLICDWEATYRGFRNEYPNENEGSRDIGVVPTNPEAVTGALNSLMIHYFAYLKPFDSTLRPDDPNNFYMEREWRKLGNFKFQQDQVVSIIVAPEYLARFEKDYPRYREKVIAAPK